MNKKIIVRNRVATSPLLKKSGIHLTETPKAKHKKNRNQIKKELKSDYWL